MILVVLLVVALWIVFGAMVLKRGWWPRRVGDTPHCRKCDYILSGDQRRCPECGSTLQPRSVVRGERHRNLLLAGIGGVFIACGGLALSVAAFGLASDWVQRINSNENLPLSRLLSRTDNTPSGAWDEIRRRFDKLSKADQDAVIERGLEVQNLPVPPNNGSANILDFIGRRYFDHQLTAAQEDRFVANIRALTSSSAAARRSRGPLPEFRRSGKGRLFCRTCRSGTAEPRLF